MNQEEFLINNRFIVKKAKNEVWDKETGQSHRLEPRLMKLLCLLAEKPGETVTRVLLIKEIWADYPGGNEGLNQAISFLRKLLDDASKEIIVTVPKIGYIFHGVISQDTEKPGPKNRYVPKKLMLPALAALVVIIIGLLYLLPRKTNSAGPGSLTRAQAIKFSEIDSKRDSTRRLDDSGRQDDGTEKTKGK